MLHQDLLAPWLTQHGSGVRPWLSEVAQRSLAAIPELGNEDQYALYALSRVIDALLVEFQPTTPSGTWSGPPTGLLPGQLTSFTAALGLRAVSQEAFSPFFHEIVTVEQDSNEDETPTLVRALWPAIMLGNILVARAGVEVRAGRDYLRKEIAETSRMYWATRRRNRPRADLSDGWGSNSSWATFIRLDFCIGGSLIFNFGQNNDLSVPSTDVDRDGLTREERLELLTFRCFVRTEKPDCDLWPYDDTLRLPDDTK